MNLLTAFQPQSSVVLVSSKFFFFLPQNRKISITNFCFKQNLNVEIKQYGLHFQELKC